MWTYIIGIVLVAHGLIHAIGFSTAWELADAPGLSGRTTIQLPEPAQRAFGLLWLVALVGFVGAGLGLLFEQSWWLSLTVVAAAISAIPVVVWWRDAWIGLVVDVAAVAVVVGAASLNLPT